MEVYIIVNNARPCVRGLFKDERSFQGSNSDGLTNRLSQGCDSNHMRFPQHKGGETLTS